MLNSNDDTDRVGMAYQCSEWDCKTKTEQHKPQQTKEDSYNPLIAVDSPHSKEKQSGG
jgi:hypothetical protein